MKERYICMYKTFDNDLWLSSHRDVFQEENSANVINGMKEKFYLLQTSPNSKLLNTRMLNPRGELILFNGFSEKHKEFPWKDYWTIRTQDIRLHLTHKEYNLMGREGWNLSCPDFRCNGYFPIQRERSMNLPLSCSMKHYPEDPFSIIPSEFLERISPQISDENLAKKLQEFRGTKAQALFLLQSWKETIELQLEHWNPF